MGGNGLHIFLVVLNFGYSAVFINVDITDIFVIGTVVLCRLSSNLCRLLRTLSLLGTEL